MLRDDPLADELLTRLRLYRRPVSLAEAMGGSLPRWAVLTCQQLEEADQLRELPDGRLVLTEREIRVAA